MMGTTQTQPTNQPAEIVKIYRKYRNQCPYNQTSNYESEIIRKVHAAFCRCPYEKYSIFITGPTKFVIHKRNIIIKHWWVVLESNYAFYCINFSFNDLITIYRTKDKRAAFLAGLDNIEKPEDKRVKITNRGRCYIKLKEFIELVDDFQGYYRFQSNSCLDITKKIYEFA